MNRSTVYQHALALLGEVNYKQHTGTDGICYQEYPDAVRQANAMSNWSFARSKRVLKPLGKEASDGIFVYNLPADCLRVLELRDTVTGQKVRHFEIYGRTLEIQGHPSDNVTLVYTSDILASRDELPDEAPLFCKYVITLLAARICPTITGNPQLTQSLEAQAQQFYFDALTQDRQQARSNDQHPLKGIMDSNISITTSRKSQHFY